MDTNHASAAITDDTILVYPRVGYGDGYPDTLDDFLAFGALDPSVGILKHSALQDVLSIIFSHLSFIERVCVAPVCRAFYTAYRNFIDRGPLLQLVLTGDYMNVARTINKLSAEKRELLTESPTFVLLMFLGGMPMVSLMNSLGGCRQQYPSDYYQRVCVRYHFMIHCVARNERVLVCRRISRGLESRSPDELVLGRRYDLLEQQLAETHLTVAPGNAYPTSLQSTIEELLPTFHARCVPSTPLCMLHQTHVCLPIAIPQIIIDIHARKCMDVKLLAVCIRAARAVHNADDEKWLQNRYPDLYWCASALGLRIQDVRMEGCNMKHAGNYNDTFDILRVHDALALYKRI